MRKFVILACCLVSFMAAKECKTVADQINGCTITVYDYQKRPIKQTSYKNKQATVVYEREYKYDGSYKECHPSQNSCKYYDASGAFVIEYRDNEPYNGRLITDEGKTIGEYKDGLKVGFWKDGPILDVWKNGAIVEGRAPNGCSSKDRGWCICEVGEYVNGIRHGAWKEFKSSYDEGRINRYTVAGDFQYINSDSLISEGNYINGKKHGVWKMYNKSRINAYFDRSGAIDYTIFGEFKDGKLISVKDEYGGEYEFLDNIENITLDKAIVGGGERCIESLIPTNKNETNPKDKMIVCYEVGTHKPNSAKISLEGDYGFFTKNLKVKTYELFFDKYGKIVLEESKCPNGRAMFRKVVQDENGKTFSYIEKLEEMISSGKKYTKKTYDRYLYYSCHD